MDRIAKALATHDEAYADVARLLFGDGADELVAKMSPGQSDLSSAARKKKAERTKAQVGLASNVVGLAAGVAGTGAALRDDRFKEGGKAARKIYGAGKKIPSPISSKGGRTGAKLAGGALGLQVANIAGDAIANRVLARSAKKDPKKVSKSMAEGKLVKIAGAAKDNFDNSRTVKSSKAKLKQIRKDDGYLPTDVNVKRGTLKMIGSQAEQRLPKVQAKAKQKTLKMIETGKGKNPDTVKKQDLDVTWTGEFSKVDEDKRQVFGYASVVFKDGDHVVDRQGDYISIEEIEKSAYNYVIGSRKGGDMHRREGDLPYHGSDMIESFLVTDEKVEKMGLPEDTPRGWWVGFQVNDDALWDKVKSGERTGFSIHGAGQRLSKVL